MGFLANLGQGLSAAGRSFGGALRTPGLLQSMAAGQASAAGGNQYGTGFLGGLQQFQNQQAQQQRLGMLQAEAELKKQQMQRMMELAKQQEAQNLAFRGALPAATKGTPFEGIPPPAGGEIDAYKMIAGQLGAGPEASKYSINPQIVKTPKGYGYVTFNEKGQSKVVDMPPGYEAIKPVAQTDLGNQVVYTPWGSTTPVAALPKGVPPQDLPSTRGQQAQAVTQAQEGTKLQYNKASSAPKALSAYQALVNKRQVGMELLNEAIDTTSWMSAGPAAKAAGIPATPPNKLRNLIKSIEAQVAINELLDLKESSPSGASGLGAMSDREGQLLRDMLGSLDQEQEPEMLKKTLVRIKNHLAKSTGQLGTELQTTFGDYLNQPAPVPDWAMQNVPQPSPPPAGNPMLGSPPPPAAPAPQTPAGGKPWERSWQ